jgi:hypothetical protein
MATEDLGVTRIQLLGTSRRQLAVAAEPPIFDRFCFVAGLGLRLAPIEHHRQIVK